MGESITNGVAGQTESGPWCECCDELIIGEPRHDEGERLCSPCWGERMADGLREEIEEYRSEAEAAGAEIDMRQAEYLEAAAALKDEFEADMGELRDVLAAWVRRLGKARERLAELARTAAAMGSPPAPALPPIAGGGADGPTERDWADYREHFDREDARQGEPDWPADGNPVMWGYE